MYTVFSGFGQRSYEHFCDQKILIKSSFFSGNYTCNTLRRFQCNNHKCIPLYQKCDGIDNCGDGSDENNMTICSRRPRPSIFNEFRCANEKCIEAEKICNHVDDCGDNSDELGCRKFIYSCFCWCTVFFNLSSKYF